MSESSVSEPFDVVERALASPLADGMFVTFLEPGCEVPLAVGEVITHVGDTESVDFGVFQQLMQPEDGDDTDRIVRVRTAHRTETRSLSSGARGYRVCAVRAGVSGWEDKPDTTTPPDFSAFAADSESWMTNNFGESVAGFERLRIERSDDQIDAEVLMCMGGPLPDGNTWDYRARSSSTHRLDPGLSLIRTAYWEGRPDAEIRHGEVFCDESATPPAWVGQGIGASGEEGPVQSVWRPHALTGYTLRLLPLTMPLEVGASRTVWQASDGLGVVTGRSRLECNGREALKVAGEITAAWRFVWRHYGHRKETEDEKFYVTDDRKLVRIEWGDFYNGCWCEALPENEVRKRIPNHVEVA